MIKIKVFDDDNESLFGDKVEDPFLLIYGGSY